MNVGSSSSYRRPEGETTEWEDILVAKGIIAPKVDPAEKARKEALEESIAEAAAAVDPLERKSLAELERMGEEDDEFADTHVLEGYRRARLEAMKAVAARNKFGMLFPLSRPDFVREVTEASKEAYVVVLLYKDAITESRLLEGVMHRVAAKHRAAKFMKIPSESCIEGYPDRNVPTLFVYRHGEVCASIVGLGTLGGAKVSDDIVEWVLSRHGVVETDLEDDPRSGAGSSGGGSGRSGASTLRFGPASGGGSRRGGGRYDSDEDDE